MTCLPSLTDPVSHRLLGNILNHAPAGEPAVWREDPALQFLEECSGFAIVIAAVSYRAEQPQSLRDMCLQQETAYHQLRQVFSDCCSQRYFCLTTEAENRLVALFGRTASRPLDPVQFSQYLTETVMDTLRTLCDQQQIPLQMVFGIQSQLSRLNQTYTRLKNAVTYLDFVQQPHERIVYVAELEEKQHIGLLSQLEDQASAFLNALRQDDIQAAMICIDRVIARISDWIPMSQEALLSDIQHFFDGLTQRLRNQFGEDIAVRLCVNEAIFESNSLPRLKAQLERVIRTLFEYVREKSSGLVFAKMSEIRGYMDAHSTHCGLSAGVIAQRFGMSPQLLSIQFKKCFHITPAQYLEQKRMEQLKYYLRHTNLKLEELCPLVGIGSITTLHRTFQKHFGQSPGAYRKAVDGI